MGGDATFGCALGVMLGTLLSGVVPALGEPVAGAPFARVWERMDGAVARGAVARTWVWGPEARTGAIVEPYRESPGGNRLVQYWDKGRMEVTTPDAEPGSEWYVTSGLLATELLTGRVQLGHDTFEQWEPAEVNVAGDADDPNGVTYATFATLRDLPAAADDEPVTKRVARDGAVRDEPELIRYGATAAWRIQVPGIDHQIASPFWEFMNASGPVVIDGEIA